MEICCSSLYFLNSLEIPMDLLRVGKAGFIYNQWEGRKKENQYFNFAYWCFEFVYFSSLRIIFPTWKRLKGASSLPSEGTLVRMPTLWRSNAKCHQIYHFIKNIIWSFNYLWTIYVWMIRILSIDDSLIWESATNWWFFNKQVDNE